MTTEPAGALRQTSNKFELMKAERDGLDALEDILRYAAAGTPVEEIPDADLQRMKWYGVFHRPVTPGEFMMRLRLPGGVVTTSQARAIADVAVRFGHGAVDLTTRENIQLRGLRLTEIPVVFEVLWAAGVEHRQTGLDNVRNLVACPLAGLDAGELLDARPILDAISAAYLGMRSLSNLPRKFNVAVAGCHEDCTDARSHDLAFVPATREAGGESVVGFNVLVGGALGGTSPRLATPLDAFVTPDEVPALVLAVLSVFRDHGARAVRTRARLKWLIEDWGAERFRAAIEGAFGGDLAPAGTPTPLQAPGDHLGVHRQRQEGLRYVGLHVPVGRVTAAQLLELARLAESYGSSELRLTASQNVIIPGVAERRVAALLAEPLLTTFSPNPSSVWRGLVACTGTDYCHYSLIDTKSRAVELASALEERGFDAPDGFRIHLSGCVHACGKHHIADLGLQGANVRLDGQVIEAADIYVGGAAAGAARLGERVARQVPAFGLADRVIELFPAHVRAPVAVPEPGDG